MIDRDLAVFYQIETKRLNEQVKRNIDRFPNDFRFQLTNQEKDELVAKCDRFKNLKYSSSNPYAFTEQGVSMLSAALKSKVAVEISIKIIRAFVNMRKILSQNSYLSHKIQDMEKRQISYEIKTDSKIDKLFELIDNKNKIPMQGVFYNGQIYDAYALVNNILSEAKQKVILIDNYIDDRVLTIFSKYPKLNFTVIILKISKQLQLDIDKYNTQYKNLSIRKSNKYHDRFLLIDNKKAYHIGASLKDLGKKVFAFSKIDIGMLDEK